MVTANQLIISKTVANESNRLFHFIRTRVKSTLDAEDILQDVFFQLARISDDITSIEKISAWLFQVARNRITDLYRKKKTLSFSEMNRAATEEGLSLNFECYIPDSSDLPDTILVRKKVWELLKEGLAEIPTEQSSVFTMHELDGLSFKKIEEITGIQVNTLISRKRYAIVYLRKKMGDLYSEILDK